MRSLRAFETSFPLTKPFTISRGSVSDVELIEVQLMQAQRMGRGECRPYPRYDETALSVLDQIESVREAVEGGCDRDELSRLMPAGAARSALDAALLDLEAKISDRPAFELLGLAPPKPVLVTYTIGLDTPERMAREARSVDRPLLKLKLGGEGDPERVAAVRDAVPDSRLIVDANEAWTIEQARAWLPLMAEHGVELVEQPLHADHDEAMRGLERPVPICADESCHDRHGLERLSGLYDFINIKLDKTGGPTEALALADAAQARGLRLMLGCMMASSLAMAPAFLLASRAEFVDLDAPLLLARDREHACSYVGAMMSPPSKALWG